jgi:hypothetical protein
MKVEAVTTYFKLPSLYLPGEAEENYKKTIN